VGVSGSSTGEVIFSCGDIHGCSGYVDTLELGKEWGRLEYVVQSQSTARYNIARRAMARGVGVLCS
jgi:hypothetical protein